MADTTLLRAYDSAVVARFTPAVVGGAYQVAIPDLSKSAALGVGMPSEWFEKFGMPYISITRGMEMPAPNRYQPGNRSQVVSPVDAGLFDIQRAAPLPVSIPYTVELVTDSMGDLNVLSMFLTTVAMPFMGFGTTVSVFGQDYAFVAVGGRDKTDYATKEGRVFRFAYDYMVEGWLFSLASDTCARVVSLDTTLETYGDTININSTPPPAVETADEVTEVIYP